MSPEPKAFFEQLIDFDQVICAFEYLPGVFFLIKDTEGRFMAANSATCDRLGVTNIAALLGKTDSDFVPDDLVKDFRKDDLKVIRTGKPLLNRLEIWFDEQRQLQWFLTTKLPLRNKQGRCIGVMAIIRRYEEGRASYSVQEVADAVAYLRENLSRSLTTADLARAVGVSERNFYRKLEKAMGITPHELMLRVRTEAAAECLALSDVSIAEIGLQHGFCDQSAFTRHFRNRTGLTPRQFRLRHRGAG